MSLIHSQLKIRKLFATGFSVAPSYDSCKDPVKSPYLNKNDVVIPGVANFMLQQLIMYLFYKNERRQTIGEVIINQSHQGGVDTYHMVSISLYDSYRYELQDDGKSVGGQL